eukprot:gene9432-biopygen7559
MLPGETPDLQDNEQLPDSLKLSVLDAKSNKNKDYRIGKLIEPHRLENFTDKDDHGILDKSFDKDLVWGIAGGLPQPDTGNEEHPQIGSWTAFQKQVSDVEIIKSVINYMPTIDAPPEYNVCKDYLDSMVDIMEILDVPNIFVHADEQVYARVLHLMWKHKEEYKNIIPILGGFHQLRVLQKIIYKRHSCMGYGDWFADAGSIASGSLSQAVEGRHYYRCMRLHKEGFDALIQNRVEDITSNYASMDKNLKEKLIELRKNPSPGALEKVLVLKSFHALKRQIMIESGTQAKMTVKYLKDISLMLALVSAVREKDFERHLQAERQMLKLVFAFDHINYGRYNTYQHVFLRRLEAFNDLALRGHGASESGDIFSCIHGDLVTEHFNGATKGTAGPFQAGYSTNTDAVSRWISTSHIHCKMRSS